MPIPSASVNHILDHVLPVLDLYKRSSLNAGAIGPFTLGLTGLQGSGKSTWANSLVESLRARGLAVATVSLDDFYHNHENLIKLRDSNPSNGLLRTRGQPGTHDVQLAQDFFRSLHATETNMLAIPAFDKSKFNGEGDRVPKELWKTIPNDPPLDVIIFEGWCLGFRPISNELLEKKWANSMKTHNADTVGDATDSFSTNTLWGHSLEHLTQVNDHLRSYCSSFMGPSHFDLLLHLDTDDLSNVYRWRIDQEQALRKARNTGMTDEQVVTFVKGYMASYELYLDGLRSRPFVLAKPWSLDGMSHNIRVVLDKDRHIADVLEMPGGS